MPPKPASFWQHHDCGSIHFMLHWVALSFPCLFKIFMALASDDFYKAA
jgi:hypothetical protein